MENFKIILNGNGDTEYCQNRQNDRTILLIECAVRQEMIAKGFIKKRFPFAIAIVNEENFKKS